VRPSATERALALALAGGRLAIGAGFWLAPDLMRRALGFGELDPEVLAISRVAGTRDLVLGAWQAGASGDRARLRRASAAIAVCDGGDTVAFASLLAGGRTRAGLRGVSAALPATLAGAWLAARLH
jgi:hypothetical protein